MLYQQIARNKRKTIFLLVLFVAIVACTGSACSYLFANNFIIGAIWAGLGSFIYLVIILANPARLVMSLNHAKQINESNDPQLYHIVQDMALVAKVPMPKVYEICDDSPNAFATGRDPKHAAIAVTSGLRTAMNREELEGVIGHEMSHIKNYDILISTIGVVLTAVISFISSFASRYIWWGDWDDNDSGIVAIVFKLVASLVIFLLGPLAAALAQMALSRSREYQADAGSVELTRNPQGLISALTKIENSQPMKHADRASAGLYIENPFHKSGLFDTHPATSDRIARLKKM